MEEGNFSYSLNNFEYFLIGIDLLYVISVSNLLDILNLKLFIFSSREFSSNVSSDIFSTPLSFYVILNTLIYITVKNNFLFGGI